LDGTLESTIPKCDFSHYSCLGGLERAIDEGIPVLGYQHWSVMENFVWAEGYDPRFGLIYVDFATGERIIKESAWEYERIIEENGNDL
jgi:beta-glucosidase